MLKSKFFWLLFLVVGLAAAYFFFIRDTSEMAQAARSATDYRGQITAGAKFGVTIGDSAEAAADILRKQKVYYDEYASEKYTHPNPNECHGFEYKDIDKINRFTDHSWRRGIVCLVIRDGDVVAMSWFFQPGSP